MKTEVKENGKLAKAITRFRKERKKAVAWCKAAGAAEAEEWLLKADYINLTEAVVDAKLFGKRKLKGQQYCLPEPGMKEVTQGYRESEATDFDEDSFQEGFFSHVLTFWRENIEDIVPLEKVLQSDWGDA